ncbi:MAG: hypothetical protein RIC19_09730 [Phaeodactylibacter sp.]|uniref:hypothetical protein n=1 Tax=Phaeodactylibacter sp. TaxID=1940289 RepID=UPI0032EDA77D
MMNDCLESEEDLQNLFGVLQHYKDHKGNHPIFTANTIVANPDFDKIAASSFEEYYFEPFTNTYRRYYAGESVFETFQSGIRQKLFWPQLHGREHLNLSRWMRDLKEGVAETHLSFNYGMTGISRHITQSNRGSYQAAFDGRQSEALYDKKTILKDAVYIFKDIFGFQSQSFIAPNYIWDEGIENHAHELGIKYFQGSRVQRLPKDHGDRLKIRRHYMGQRNHNDQRYLVRNADFEPTLDNHKDSVGSCLEQINRAFRWRKPAVICTHRVNYIGSLNPDNAKQNLAQLNQLISSILERWPNVEFMTSDQLGQTMDADG